MSFVAAQFPQQNPGSVRLAIIGEAPGLEEQNWRVCDRGHQYPGRRWQQGSLTEASRCPACASIIWKSIPTPFVGPSGRLLNDCLLRAGWSRDRVFVSNISQRELHGADLEDPGKLQWGMDQLHQDLKEFKPHVVLCLGNCALRAFHPWHWRKGRATPEQEEAAPPPESTLKLETEEEGAPKPKKKRPPAGRSEFSIKIGDWRGSVFLGQLPMFDSIPYKCVASYHPAAILRTAGPAGAPGANPEFLPLLRFDVKRALEEAKDPSYSPPGHVFQWGEARDTTHLFNTLEEIRTKKLRVAFDLEGYATTGMTDCSFAWSSSHALWIPFRTITGEPWWSPQDQQAIMDRLRLVLEDPTIPKVMHHALYEWFVLRWAHQIRLAGVVGDTMLAWHEYMPELDKALDVPASILTRQPYWKHGREGAETEEERAAYNCTDSCVTWELDAAILPLLTSAQRSHYELNVSLLPAMADMMFRGIRFDAAARGELVAGLQQEILTLQGELDELAGIPPPTLAEVSDVVCFKKKLSQVQKIADLTLYAKPSWKAESEGPHAPTTQSTSTDPF